MTALEAKNELGAEVGLPAESLAFYDSNGEIVGDDSLIDKVKYVKHIEKLQVFENDPDPETQAQRA